MASSSSSLTFADLLRHQRMAAGLTQEELAARASLSVDAISTLERGTRRRPRKDTVALLADALALPDEERVAFAAAARRTSAASLVATPPADVTPALDGHNSALAPTSDASLPHGSVSFLFADIESSTRLLQQLGGERYASMLAEVQALLRTVWAAHAGHELGTQGDHFFVVFAHVEDALAAAAAAQRALATLRRPDQADVRLRMGVHIGAALLTAGRYVGQEVQRAARIAAAGHGGQVVVSHAVADHMTKYGYELPAGTKLRDLGKHRLQDLRQREQLYQFELADVPDHPANFPPLRTLDAWPGLRADLTAVAGMSAALLAPVGLLLALAVPAFPWVIGLGAAGLAALTAVAAVLAQPVRRALTGQWRRARKPVAAVTSTLLSLVVIVTTLFITKPPLVLGSQQTGYDFTYSYHTPTQRGGAIVVGTMNRIITLAPPLFSINSTFPMWQGCVIQLPDLKLGLDGWKPDQCTEVPTVANGGESLDARTTTIHLDPRATWSDGMPITAADFLFFWRLLADPNTFGGYPPYNQMQLSAPDAHTIRIEWATPTADYLYVLEGFTPMPLHVYATGKFSGVYNPQTGAYNSAIAQQLVNDPGFYPTPPVDNGPFMMKRFVKYQEAVLVRNPYFFSNFLHAPALDQITFVSGYKDFAAQLAKGETVSEDKAEAALIAGYRSGAYTLVDGLPPLALKRLGGIPKAQVVTVPNPSYLEFWFNERTVAPNAQANGGSSIFADRTVRQAFTEAFDRCSAVRALLGVGTCTDPNLFTDEPVGASFPDYDSTFHLPAYNPTDATALLDRAGYRVVDGIRRYKDGKSPIQLTVVLSNGAVPSSALITRMQQDWSRNLHVQLSVTNDPNISSPPPQNSLWRGAFDLFMFGSGGLTPDPVGYLTGFGPFDNQDIPTAQNTGLNNLFGVIDPHVQQRDQVGEQTLDFDQRVEVYRVLDRYFAQQFYMEVLYAEADVALIMPTLCNVKQWPSFWYDTWNSADWYLARGSTCP